LALTTKESVQMRHED